MQKLMTILNKKVTSKHAEKPLLSAQEPSKPQPKPLEISAWVLGGIRSSSGQSFDTHADQLSTISPFWFGLTDSGDLRFLSTPHRDAALLYRACRSNVRIIPTITNSYNGNMLHTILADEKLQKYHLQVIVEEVLDRDYDGIDIDYENVLAEDKDRYSSFIQALADALHQEEKMLTVTVQGKTWDAAGMNGPGGQDYQLLAQNADELRVMAYGWCWRTGCVGSMPPGPIGPMHWLQNIIRYSITQAPKDKIVLGLHLYGYHWTKTESGFNGRALVWKQADKLLQEYNLKPEWWQTDAKGQPVQEPWISFEDGAQSITFANAKSVTARIELAKRTGIRGVILWRLGGEDPKLWANLSTSVPPITPTIES